MKFQVVVSGLLTHHYVIGHKVLPPSEESTMKKLENHNSKIEYVPICRRKFQPVLTCLNLTLPNPI